MHTADTRTNLVITLGCDGLCSPKSAALGNSKRFGKA